MTSTATASSFQKIDDWREQPEEYQKAVYCDEKIWFFGQRFLDQPTYHFGHHVVFGGASSDFFDLKTRHWSQGGSKPFPAVATEEYLDEILFTYQSHIFLLLYVHFGKLQLHSLHLFDKEKRVWKKFADFGPIQVPSATESKNILILVDGTATYGVFFFSQSNNNYGFNVLEFDGGTANWKKLDCAMLNDLNSSQLQPTQAAYSKCQSERPIRAHLHHGRRAWLRLPMATQPNDSHQFRWDKCDGTAHSDWRSTFKAHAQLQLRRPLLAWHHRKRHLAPRIMTASHMGQTITGSFQPPTWTKLALEVPQPGDGSTKAPHIVYVREKNQLFVASPSFGVLAAPMTGC